MTHLTLSCHNRVRQDDVWLMSRRSVYRSESNGVPKSPIWLDTLSSRLYVCLSRSTIAWKRDSLLVSNSRCTVRNLLYDQVCVHLQNSCVQLFKFDYNINSFTTLFKHHHLYKQIRINYFKATKIYLYLNK